MDKAQNAQGEALLAVQQVGGAAEGGAVHRHSPVGQRLECTP